MQTYLTYRAITIALQRTSFEQENILSDDGVDVLYRHCTITAQGIVNQSVNPGGVSNAVFLQTLRNSFAEPRGYLNYYTVDASNNQEFIITQNGMDAKNGPVCNAQFFEMNGSTIYCTVKVETWLPACAASTDPVLSNRWNQKVHIDKDGMSTITTDGILVVRTDANINPDSLRELIVPVRTIPLGFQRIDQEYTQTKDNTQLAWSIVDQEKYRPAVDQITDWEGTWRESTGVEQGSGAIIQGTLSVRASAPKTVSKATIFEFLAKVAFSRIILTGSSQSDRIMSYEVIEGLSTNELTLNLQVFITSKTNNAWAPMKTRIGNPVNPTDISSNLTLIPPRGTALAIVFANLVSSSCSDHINQGSGAIAADNSQQPQSSGKKVNISNQPITSEGNNAVSNDQVANPYINYTIETHVECSHNNVQLPIANGDSENTATVASLAGQTTKKVVNFHAERIGALPQLPDPELDENHVLLNQKIIMMDQRLLADGSDYITGINGWYEYALLTPINVGSSAMLAPRNPMIDASMLTADTREITSEIFQSGITTG